MRQLGVLLAQLANLVCNVDQVPVELVARLPFALLLLYQVIEISLKIVGICIRLRIVELLLSLGVALYLRFDLLRPRLLDITLLL